MFRLASSNEPDSATNLKTDEDVEGAPLVPEPMLVETAKRTTLAPVIPTTQPTRNDTPLAPARVDSSIRMMAMIGGWT